MPHVVIKRAVFSLDKNRIIIQFIVLNDRSAHLREIEKNFELISFFTVRI